MDAPDDAPNADELSGSEDAPDAELAEEPFAKAEVPLGTDEGGLGLETFDGRGETGSVRRRNGSTRPPNTPPDLWRRGSAKEKTEAIKDYLDELAKVRLAKSTPAAPALPAVPQLPMEAPGRRERHGLHTVTNSWPNLPRSTMRASQENYPEKKWNLAHERKGF